MDFQIPTTWHGLVNYLTKYITKPEVRSDWAVNVMDMQNVVPTANVVERVKSYLLKEICQNRDMGKEEAMRIVMGNAGYHCSHQFKNISFDSVKLQPNFISKTVQTTNEADLVYRTYFDVYADRNLPQIKQ